MENCATQRGSPFLKKKNRGPGPLGRPVAPSGLGTLWAVSPLVAVSKTRIEGLAPPSCPSEGLAPRKQESRAVSKTRIEGLAPLCPLKNKNRVAPLCPLK